MLSHVRSAARRALARLHDRSPDVLRRLRGRVLILGYHRVLPVTELRRQFVQPGMYVRPEVFEAHVRFLRQHFRIVSLADFLVLQRLRTWDPGQRYCVITFDDGWLDNYLYAYPILRHYQVPATIFVSTGLIESDEWLWPDRLGWLLSRAPRREGAATVRERLGPLAGRFAWLAEVIRRPTPARIDAAIEICKRVPMETVTDLIGELTARLGVEIPKRPLFLQWRDIAEMSRAGVTFGSHAVTHRQLPTLSDADLRMEVAGSLQTLRRSGANWLPVFCYPNGDYAAAVLEEVRGAGYTAAVSTDAGAERWDAPDPFRLRRVGVHDDVSATPALLAFHLSRVGAL
jgi:peptidoglycan/xylan/chitin deacetylase (PgdA/CDA1 family)